MPSKTCNSGVFELCGSLSEGWGGGWAAVRYTGSERACVRSPRGIKQQRNKGRPHPTSVFSPESHERNAQERTTATRTLEPLSAYA